MKAETLLRALAAVREKIEAADEQANDWLAERDRRRRQEAAFLRGIVRAEGSQRKASVVTGIPQRTISRTINPEGHAKARADMRARREPTSQNVGSPPTEPPADNVVSLFRFKDFYRADVDYAYQPEVRAVVTMLEDLNDRQLAYLFDHVLPAMEASLIRRKRHVKTSSPTIA